VTGFVRLRAAFERLMEWIVIALMTVLFVEVTLGVVFRAAGASLAWYDEVASVLLAWLTYYASALAALKRAHIGFPGLVRSLPRQWRVPAFLVAEALVLGFFALLAWVGWDVLEVLATDNLVSLPSISVKYTQSVIPIGAALFIVAELLIFPEVLAETRRGSVAVSDVAEKLH
jgi:TRAP-type C4-dicarboxylate transport system permease small subunit